MLPDIDQSQEAERTTEGSASSPVGTFDFDKFRGELLEAVNTSFDERFKGFQKPISRIDKKIQDLEKQVQQASRSDLTEDERTALDVQEKDEQIARLQMELELRELATEFPDVAPHFDRILHADSPRAQMEILREALSTKAPETPETPQAETSQEQPSTAQNQSVDVNNPAEIPTDGMDYEQMFERDPSLLDRILKGAPRLRTPGG